MIRIIEKGEKRMARQVQLRRAEMDMMFGRSCIGAECGAGDEADDNETTSL